MNAYEGTYEICISTKKSSETRSGSWKVIFVYTVIISSLLLFFKSVSIRMMSFDLHERTASGSHQAEHRESVHDEAHLFVGKWRVDENETHGG